MDVEVHGLSGNLLCCLEVQAAQTVADLKELIHKATQIKTNLQKLLLGNELLRNTDSCGEILTQGTVNAIVLLQTDKWIEEVAQDWRRLRKASEAVRNDKDLVLAAIDRSHGEAIKFAGDQIRADREVMLAAMGRNGSLYKYANPSLGLDVDFMKAALQQAPCRNCPLPTWQWHTSPAVCMDKTFMLLMVARQGVALQHAGSELRNDEELVRAAMHGYPHAFQHASYELRSNREFAAFAVGVSLQNLFYVSEDLRGDRNFILRCLPTYYTGQPQLVQVTTILKKLPETFASDREVVLRVLQALPHWHRRAELMRASKDLHSDAELKEVAGLQLSRPVRGYTAVERVQDLPKPPLTAESRTALQYSTTAAQNKHSFWRELLQKDPAVLAFLGKDEAVEEKDLVLAAVKKDGRMLEYASEELRTDVDLVMAALENDADVYDILPETMRCREEIALLAFRKHRIKLPKPLLSNRHVVVEAAAMQDRATEVEKRRLQKLPLAHLVAKFDLA
ncbi:unnamed protein product [Symbiodinium sp. CCMP2592]|nr:unnamed protein product [Symbiodinium sp. CCMP2592]